MARSIKKENRFADKLLKLIPSEIVAAYLLVRGMIPTEDASLQLIIEWSVFGFLTILTPLYLKKFQNVHRVSQIIFTTISFAVWVFSIGGPFALYNFYMPEIASIALAMWTLLIPLAVDEKIDDLASA